ncbi:MAG: Nif3-like dinuclear metal center hexameric protein [Ruminococcus sp.]
MTVNDILNYTETFAPISTAADFDNCGVLVGEKDTVVTKAILALDITSAVVEEAKREKAQLIISHHPIIFNPLKKVEKDSVVYKLIENNITALCLHTNLDLSPTFGVNTCLGEALGLEKGSFVPDTFAYIGELSSPMSSREFAQRAKERLNCKGVKYTNKDTVQRICVSSGAGAEEIETAIENHCDLFLTGEMKHHLYIEAMEKGIAVVELGHFKSEDVVIEPLARLLSQKFPQIEFTKTQAVIDNVEYL